MATEICSQMPAIDPLQSRSQSPDPFLLVSRDLKRGFISALAGLARESAPARGTGAIAPATHADQTSTRDLAGRERFFGLLTYLFRIVVLVLAEDKKLVPEDWPGAALLEAFRDYDLLLGITASGDSGTTRLSRELDGLCDRLNASDGRQAEGISTPFFPAQGDLFRPATIKALQGSCFSDPALARAVMALLYPADPGTTTPHDLSAMAPEALGSLYESLLPYFPRILKNGNHVGDRSVLTEARDPSRTERRRTGSYYTRRELVEALVRSALIPALIDRLHGEDLPVRKDAHLKCGLLKDHVSLTTEERSRAEAALLRFKVVDPACGGAVFLMTAQNFLAGELLRIRFGPGDVRESHRTQALEDVLRHCIYGVDKDPLALDLARISLWLNTGSRNLTLSALHGAFKCGNALLGCPLQGDGEGKSNRTRQACDQWTADFFRTGMALRNKRKTKSVPEKATPESGSSEDSAQAADLAAKLGFFHWHLEFPHVFDGPDPGFDCVLGNPPWERIKLQEREFFAGFDSPIAEAGRASVRRGRIRRLKDEDPALYALYEERLHAGMAFSRFLRSSGRYALAARGDPNVYLFFADLSRALLASRGRAGIIVPSGIATDKGASRFFWDLMEKQALVSLYDLSNQKRLFPEIAGPNRFSLLTMAGKNVRVSRSQFSFNAQSLIEVGRKEGRFTLALGDLKLLNPNTRTCPPFASKRDADRIKKIYRRLPILVRESEAGQGESEAGRRESEAGRRESEAGQGNGNPWGIRFWSMFHMSSHSHLFRTGEQLACAGAKPDPFGQLNLNGERWLRLYESKLMHNLNHRYNTFEGMSPRKRKGIKPGTLPMDAAKRQDPSQRVEPRFWVPEAEVVQRTDRAKWDRRWFLALRSITNVSTNRRSVVASILPWCGVGNSASLVHTGPSAETAALLVACFSSFAFDFVARTKLGGPNLNFFILKQLPVPKPDTFERPFRNESLRQFITSRVLELVYTAHDVEPFARDMGYQGPPFAWDAARRERLRSELDALFFLLYGMRRSELESVFDSFPILKRRELALGREFRTQRLTLKAYDLMAEDWKHD